LAKEFDRDVAAVDTFMHRFLDSSDAANTQELRKATGRLWVSFSLLPKRLRKDRPLRRYASTSKRLSNAAGKGRDLDTIAAWTSDLAEGKDRRPVESDLRRLRTSAVKGAIGYAKDLRRIKAPLIDREDFKGSDVETRTTKVERRLARRVDREFEEFLSTQ